MALWPVQQNKVGAQAGCDAAPVRQPHGSGRIARNQRPKGGQRGHTVCMQAHHRTKHRRIVVVRGKDIAQAARDHVGSPRAAQVAAATHGIRRAKHDRVASVPRGQEDTLVHREFGHFRTKRPVIAARFRLTVIMAQHRRALGPGKGCDAVDMAGNLGPLCPDAGDQRHEIVGAHMRPFRPVAHLAQKAVCRQIGDRVVRNLIKGTVVQGHIRMQQRRRGMVVKRQ